MIKTAIFAAVAFQAAFVSQTEAHGNIILPKPTGDSDHVYYYGDPAGTIDQPDLVGDASYGDYYIAAAEYFQENGITSLKDYIALYGSNISECGWTLKDGTAQPVPSDGYAEHDTLGNSHVGPCEIWCDNTRVFNSSNCQADFAGESPTMIPIDVETCVASSELVFYWLALHQQPWQVYINCVALDGTSSSASEASLTSDDETNAEAAKEGVVVITSSGSIATSTASTTTSSDAASGSVDSTAAATTATSTSTSSTESATDTTATSTGSESTGAEADTDASFAEASDEDEAGSTTSTDTATTTTTATTASTPTSSTASADKCSVRRKRT